MNWLHLVSNTLGVIAVIGAALGVIMTFIGASQSWPPFPEPDPDWPGPLTLVLGAILTITLIWAAYHLFAGSWL